MKTDNLTFITVFFDRDVDADVRAHARPIQAKPGSISRLFMEVGMAQVAQDDTLLAPGTYAAVMRMGYLAIASDESLTTLACRLRMDKSALTWRVTRQGMCAIRAALDGRSERTQLA